jgi:flavin-dependent dehydrogenase
MRARRRDEAAPRGIRERELLIVVDALGWRRVLSSEPDAIQPPDARLSRGLEVHPKVADAASRDLAIWLDCDYIRPGYSWEFPAGDEVRDGVGSFDPRVKVKRPTVDLARDLGVASDGYQGNWIPHALRPATEDGVFFVGDSAGHCLPATAEGIRTAFYFGLACGRELRAVLDGRSSRVEALGRYRSFCEERRRIFDVLLHIQNAVGHVNPRPRAMTAVVGAMDNRRFLNWSFGRYLRIAPPEYALAS